MDPSLGPSGGTEEYDPTAPAVTGGSGHPIGGDYLPVDSQLLVPAQGDGIHSHGLTSDATADAHDGTAEMPQHQDDVTTDGFPPDHGSRNSRSSIVCYRCGGRGHMANDCRPNAYGAPDVQHECYKCKGKGHFARECPTLKYEKCFLCGRFGHHGMDCRERNLGSRGGPPRDNYMDRGPAGNFGPRYGSGPNPGRNYGPSYPNQYQDDRFRGPEPRGYREPFGQSPYNQDFRRDPSRQSVGGVPGSGQGIYGDNGVYSSFPGQDNLYGGAQDSYQQAYDRGFDEQSGVNGPLGGFSSRPLNAFDNRGGYRDYDRDRDSDRDRERDRDRYDARPSGMGADALNGRGPICYRCQQPGHIAKDCVNSAVPGARPVAERCFRCGDPNHISRFCTANGVSSEGRDSCFKCGGTGHKSRDCSGPDNRVCYICRKPGHVSTNCPERGYAN